MNTTSLIAGIGSLAVAVLFMSSCDKKSQNTESAIRNDSTSLLENSSQVKQTEAGDTVRLLARARENDQMALAAIQYLTKPAGITFMVDEVNPAPSFLAMDSAHHVLEQRVGKKLKFFPEEQNQTMLVHAANNVLIQTVQECYDNHRPLILTPDVIWLTICQGVSIHSRKHYDELKDKILLHPQSGKVRLRVRNDSLSAGSAHWKDLINSFTKETQKYARPDVLRFFTKGFSTTTPIEQTAYEVTVLEAYEKAFEYVGESGCGIPAIHITGTPEDWREMSHRLDLLDKLGLSVWAANLKPILEEFALAAEGHPRREFWKEIYKIGWEYNAIYLSGWIIKFFPYIKDVSQESVWDDKKQQYRHDLGFKPNQFYDGEKYMRSTLSTDDFPSGLSKISVTWDDYGTPRDMLVYAGLMGIRQFPDKSLQPFVSWVICDANAEAPDHNPPLQIEADLEHSEDYWSPHTAGRLTDSAIYDMRRFHTHLASKQYLRRLLVDSLTRKFGRLPKKASYGNLMIEVLSNGRLGTVVLTGPFNSKCDAYVTSLVRNLQEPWFPALAHPSDVLHLMDVPENNLKMKVRANSFLFITLE